MIITFRIAMLVALICAVSIAALSAGFAVWFFCGVAVVVGCAAVFAEKII